LPKKKAGQLLASPRLASKPSNDFNSQSIATLGEYTHTPARNASEKIVQANFSTEYLQDQPFSAVECRQLLAMRLSRSLTELLAIKERKGFPFSLF
jgi:hypothetical protein